MSKKSKINRRKFIKSIGGALVAGVGFPTIIPARVLGRMSVPAASNRITLGCIGVGGMGTGNLRGFLSNEAVQVLAVCDVDRDHRNQAKNMVDTAYANQDCATYNDYRSLLARNDIDTIMMAVPDQWHGIMGVEAARAGKDVYGEKPLAYTIAEGRAVVDAVNRYGVIWQTGSWQRSQRNFRFACELVRNGYVGNVHTVRVGLPYGNSIHKASTQPTEPPDGFDYDMWLGPAPWRPYCPARCHWNFRWISDYGFGQLTDWAGHHIDIANWGMGTESSAPVTIEGKAEYPPAKEGLFDTPNEYYFVCEYAEGFKMIVADARQQPKGMGTHFIGDKGWVHVSRGGIDAEPKSLLTHDLNPNEIHLYKSENHIQNFIDCVYSRAKTITPEDAAHSSIKVGHLGVIAIKLGRKVKWDNKNEQFINDRDADRLLSRPMRPPWHL